MVKELESSSEGRKKRDCSFFFFSQITEIRSLRKHLNVSYLFIYFDLAFIWFEFFLFFFVFSFP